MQFDGSFGQTKRIGYLLIGHSLRNAAQNINLPRGQTFDVFFNSLALGEFDRLSKLVELVGKLAVKELGRNIDTAGHDQIDRRKNNGI